MTGTEGQTAEETKEGPNKPQQDSEVKVTPPPEDQNNQHPPTVQPSAQHQTGLQPTDPAQNAPPSQNQSKEVEDVSSMPSKTLETKTVTQEFIPNEEDGPGIPNPSHHEQHGLPPATNTQNSVPATGHQQQLKTEENTLDKPSIESELPRPEAPQVDEAKSADKQEFGGSQPAPGQETGQQDIVFTGDLGKEGSGETTSDKATGTERRTAEETEEGSNKPQQDSDVKVIPPTEDQNNQHSDGQVIPQTDDQVKMENAPNFPSQPPNEMTASVQPNDQVVIEVMQTAEPGKEKGQNMFQVTHQSQESVHSSEVDGCPGPPPEIGITEPAPDLSSQTKQEEQHGKSEDNSSGIQDKHAESYGDLPSSATLTQPKLDAVEGGDQPHTELAGQEVELEDGADEGKSDHTGKGTSP